MFLEPGVKPLSLREAAERFVQGHPGTWLAIAVSMMAVLAIVVVLLIEMMIWIWEPVPRTQNIVDKQQAIVELKDPTKLPQVVQPMPSLVTPTPETVQRDVSGTDPGPVARFQGLARSHWHRDGREITVRYEGNADFDAVLTHYVNGFTARGYAQQILSSDQVDGVKHEYMLGSDKVKFALSKKPKGGIKVSIITVLP
jgi:hypothetical protein